MEEIKVEVLLQAALALGGLGAIFGILLSVAARVFAVEVDERVEQISEVLPGANCGACGYAGCNNFAEAVCSGNADVGGCIPGGKDTVSEICQILGKEGVESVPKKAVVFCDGDRQTAVERFVYDGSPSCKHADKMGGGFKACAYGCLGLGDCVEACPFGAMEMGDNGLPLIDEEACEGCGVCANYCPRGIIGMIPRDYRNKLVMCNSRDRGKSVVKACPVGCNGCKACTKACPQEAITMEDNLAVIDVDKCDGCGECVAKCKQGAIKALGEQHAAVEKLPRLKLRKLRK